MRFEPPGRRYGYSHRVRMDRRTMYVRVNQYPDGSDRAGEVCEVFIDSGKDGTEMRGLMHALAMSMSLAFQYGAPVEDMIDILDHKVIGEIPEHLVEVLREYTSSPLTSSDNDVVS